MLHVKDTEIVNPSTSVRYAWTDGQTNREIEKRSEKLKAAYITKESAFL